MIIFAIMEQRQAEQLLATERRASECGARSVISCGGPAMASRSRPGTH